MRVFELMGLQSDFGAVNTSSGRVSISSTWLLTRTKSSILAFFVLK